MRADADKQRVERLLQELGRVGSPGDRIYLAGGSSAVCVGWRSFTQDVDLRIEAVDDGPLLRAIRDLKDTLDVNVELAGPLDFLPAPDDWQARSVFVQRYGAVDVFHIDFALQALAKLERGFERDLLDVDAMLDRGLTTAEDIARTFGEVRPELYRFPAVAEDRLAALVERLLN